MQLLDSWKESLKFFEHKNLSLMALVTLKAIKYTYQHILKYIGILIVLVLAISMFIGPRMPGQWAEAWMVVAWAARILFLVFVYLTVRSSVMKKNWAYYRTFLMPGIVIGLQLAFLFGILHWIGYSWWLLVNIPVTFYILFSS